MKLIYAARVRDIDYHDIASEEPRTPLCIKEPDHLFSLDIIGTCGPNPRILGLLCLDGCSMLGLDCSSGIWIVITDGRKHQ